MYFVVRVSSRDHKCVQLLPVGSGDLTISRGVRSNGELELGSRDVDGEGIL